MKKITLLFCLFSLSIGFAQTLPIDFENSITTSDFIDFDGGEAMVIANPQPNGINTSSTVAQIIRTGGEVWAGSKIDLADNLDFSTNNIISMKVFTSAPIGTTVKFKLEGENITERDVQTTVTNEWEILQWDFTGHPARSNSIVFMFDFGNIGDGSSNSTFYFDDIEQLFGGEQIDLPADFEGTSTNYTMSDFGGNISELVTDPTNSNNTVIKVIKPVEAATWAGTTIGTPAGFATDIPLTLSDSKMTVRVWSPEAGTPIRLKVEDSNDPTHTCETETNTTLAGEWETLEFDFTNQAPGTELLSIGVSRGWRFNMASIFFNFDTDGTAAGEKTYYFDDVNFGNLVSVTKTDAFEKLEIFPNPTNSKWTFSLQKTPINVIEIFDLQGNQILKSFPRSRTKIVDATNLAQGIYISKITTELGVRSWKLIRQ